MGSADARHSVPDFPSPGTWSQHSGANFPPFADELRSLPHPTCFLTSVSETHVRPSTTAGPRPPGGGPSPPCPFPLEPKAKQPPVSPGDSGPTTHMTHATHALPFSPWSSRRDRRNSGSPDKKAPGFTSGSPCPTRGSHTWAPESGASQVWVPVNAGPDEPVVP